MTALSARDYRLGDNLELADLIAEHSAYERYPPPPANLADLLPPLIQSGALRCFVLHLQGSEGLKGYATATEDQATFTGRVFGHLDCLYLREDARGQGGGQMLFEMVRAWSAHRGHSELQWQTPSWNSRAQAFYRRQGATSRSKERFTLEHQVDRTRILQSGAMVGPSSTHARDKPLIRAVMDMCVLALLEREPMHAYRLLHRLRDLGFETAAHTLYPLVTRLHRQGLLHRILQDSPSGPARYVLHLEPAGREALRGWSQDWRRITERVEQVL